MDDAIKIANDMLFLSQDQLSATRKYYGFLAAFSSVLNAQLMAPGEWVDIDKYSYYALQEYEHPNLEIRIHKDFPFHAFYAARIHIPGYEDTEEVGSYCGG